MFKFDFLIKGEPAWVMQSADEHYVIANQGLPDGFNHYPHSVQTMNSRLGVWGWSRRDATFFPTQQAAIDQATALRDARPLTLEELESLEVEGW
jgi:hypothetical protein